MRKRILFLAFSLCSVRALAGDTIKYITLTPFNPTYNYQTVGFRLRPWPYIIGNEMGITSTLGVEMSFLKNNSIGVDGLFNGLLDHHDEPVHTDVYDRETAVIAYANHYLRFRKLREKGGLTFYIGAAGRKGIHNIREEWPDKDTITTTYTGFVCYGGQFGCTIHGDGPLGLNINIPIYENSRKVYFTDTRDHRRNNVQHYQTVDWRLEINLYIWLKWRDRSIYLDKKD
ncbi:MAG: hypothetical protein ACJ77K_05105 [Bacteroidia bacterium]